MLTSSSERSLDDSELDSGDDEDRLDRVAETVEDLEDYDEPPMQHAIRYVVESIGRVPAPECDNDEVWMSTFHLSTANLASCTFSACLPSSASTRKTSIKTPTSRLNILMMGASHPAINSLHST